MSKAVYVGAVSSALRDLPDGYTQVQYIESSGTQYIDTGFKPNQDTRVVMDAQITASSLRTHAVIFGCRTTATTGMFALGYAGHKSPQSFRSDYGSDQKSFEASVALNKRHMFDKSKSACAIDSNSVTNAASTFQVECNLFLFANNDAGAMNNATPMRLYSCRIYDGGSLVRDFVPCRNSGGTVGLYDMAGAVFYSGSGSGAFTAGSTVAAGAVAHKVKALYVGVDGIARKVKKAYVGVDGKARLCYAADPFASYSGKYTVSDVEVDGKPCKLYTLTTSGTLVLIDEIQYWMCGGGASGAAPCDKYSSQVGAYKKYAGGGGGGGYIKRGVLNGGSHVVTIGAGGAKTAHNENKMHSPGAATKIADISAEGATAGSLPYYEKDRVYPPGNSNGYSGGGAAGYTWLDDGTDGADGTPGTGAGDAALAYPFGLTSLKAHSAGGGAGGICSYEPHGYVKGGNGGSKGSGGGQAAYDQQNPYNLYGTGGAYGGGNGGDPYTKTMEGCTGRAANFYGGGGGGGSHWRDARPPAEYEYGYGGAGYQGVVYLLAPV